jgi:hypothetical protein
MAIAIVAALIRTVIATKVRIIISLDSVFRKQGL